MYMVCQKCRQQLPLPPHSKLFRCACGNMIPLGNSERSLPIQEHGRFSSKMRRFRDKFRKNSSRENSRSPSPSVSPRLSLIFTKPAPSGKRALLCGVTYKKEKFRLRGTLHDVHSMSDLLVRKFNFTNDSILILAEEEAFKPPTRRNILQAFKWLMEDLKSGVTLHAIVDACHSGTVLDLPWVYKENRWVDNRPPSGANKGTRGGMVFGFSACRDNQLAADTSAFSAEKTMMGAMTYTFIKAIWEIPDITYQGLLDNMHKAIENVNEARCPLLKIFQRKIDQEPVLSSSEKFNTDIRFKL
ncbi:metacaspase-1-like isoform X2 [Solanum lycopersicum]|uniref:metacaspase-1-like isoform X2 n=1 Tax=Solanum lycopersicum TaxID=4081 RepID=UPI000532FD57|nr:metacaspase-1-like isoform X2 [Solanum lycopersicum]